jgi:hypothetical protein
MPIDAASHLLHVRAKAQRLLSVRAHERRRHLYRQQSVFHCSVHINSSSHRNSFE